MSVQTDRPIAALTFDDGPDEYHTLRILEVLSSSAAGATFFMLAEQAVRFPLIVAEIQARGHEIALHGNDHSPIVGCSTRMKIQRIGRGKRRLEQVVGRPVRFFRPPYGWQDVRAYAVARMLRLHVVGWTTEGGDWLDLTPVEVATRATASLQRGGIVLLHDRAEPVPGTLRDGTSPGRLDRAEAVEELLARARAQDLAMVSLGRLLEEGTPERRTWFWRPDPAELEAFRTAH